MAHRQAFWKGFFSIFEGMLTIFSFGYYKPKLLSVEYPAKKTVEPLYPFYLSKGSYREQDKLRECWVYAVEKFIAEQTDPEIIKKLKEIHAEDCERWAKIVAQRKVQ